MGVVWEREVNGKGSVRIGGMIAEEWFGRWIELGGESMGRKGE